MAEHRVNATDVRAVFLLNGIVFEGIWRMGGLIRGGDGVCLEGGVIGRNEGG